MTRNAFGPPYRLQAAHGSASAGSLEAYGGRGPKREASRRPTRRGRVATAIRSPVGRLWLWVLGCLLMGYAFLDKGFAYWGLPPLYVGEIVLGLGLFAVMTGAFSLNVFRSAVTWMILLFVVWGAASTVPYLKTYGMDALRGGVVWGYPAFAIIAAGILIRSHCVDSVLPWYRKWVPLFVILGPLGFLLSQQIGYRLPTVPGSDIPILTIKAGDIAVHLAGIATFLTLGLFREGDKKANKWLPIKEIGLWCFLALGVLMVGAQNRGGLLSVMTAVAVVCVFKPMNRLNRFILPGIIVLVLFIAADVSIPIFGDREISAKQIITNVQSIFDSSARTYGTAEWRLLWWGTIIDYTIFGDYFWTGKGYGINLAFDDGFLTTDGTAGNRDPHNAHLSILARSGVPGFALWLTLQLTIATLLLRAHFRARAANRMELAKLNLWILGYWLATLVNMSFDVYLEGPQGGIWYWCLVGYIIALTYAQRVRKKGPSPAMTQQRGSPTRPSPAMRMT